VESRVSCSVRSPRLLRSLEDTTIAVEEFALDARQETVRPLRSDIRRLSKCLKSAAHSEWVLHSAHNSKLSATGFLPACILTRRT